MTMQTSDSDIDFTYSHRSPSDDRMATPELWNLDRQLWDGRHPLARGAELLRRPRTLAALRAYARGEELPTSSHIWPGVTRVADSIERCGYCPNGKCEWTAPGLERQVCGPCFRSALAILAVIDAKRAEGPVLVSQES